MTEEALERPELPDLDRETAGEAETEALGAALAPVLAPDGVLLLTGDLGAGKTVLTRGLAAALGVDREAVQSPTFVLVREHETAGGGAVFVHADLYRLEVEDVPALGLEELLAGPGVAVVEWAERLPPGLVDGLVAAGRTVLALALERETADADEAGERRRVRRLDPARLGRGRGG